MQYYTRLQESPIIATLAMFRANPVSRVEVIPMDDRYGRSVSVRIIPPRANDVGDSVYVCAGDNPLFVANVIALAHAHNCRLDDHRADGSL
jgi:hypothetical protein